MSSNALPAAPLPRRLDAILTAAGITDGVATIDGAPATASQLVYPGEVVAVDPGPEAGASELSPDVVDAALEQIMPAIIGLGGKIEVISAEGDEVMLKYEGPPKIKFGIELALKDNPLIENVVFL